MMDLNPHDSPTAALAVAKRCGRTCVPPKGGGSGCGDEAEEPAPTHDQRLAARRREFPQPLPVTRANVQRERDYEAREPDAARSASSRRNVAAAQPRRAMMAFRRFLSSNDGTKTSA